MLCYLVWRDSKCSWIFFLLSGSCDLLYIFTHVHIFIFSSGSVHIRSTWLWLLLIIGFQFISCKLNFLIFHMNLALCKEFVSKLSWWDEPKQLIFCLGLKCSTFHFIQKSFCSFKVIQKRTEKFAKRRKKSRCLQVSLSDYPGLDDWEYTQTSFLEEDCIKNLRCSLKKELCQSKSATSLTYCTIILF